MQSRSRFRALTFAIVLLAGLFWPVFAWTADLQPAPEPEPDLVIVKYGSILVRSTLPGARVYIDETYKGNEDSIIESVVAGEHVISCRTDDQAVSGTFLVKKNETLRLEAIFDEKKLIVLKEREPVKVEVEKKKPEPAKQEKPKKIVEPKKAEQKNPVEERRKAHLNVMRLDYEFTDKPDIQVQQKSSPSVITRYTLKKNMSGKYYRTKQGVLLCDAGPCEVVWTASFIYCDETNKTDALLLNWKETVFNGVTPSGTSKRELECCLNGQCTKMQDHSAAETSRESEIGRYRLIWSKGSVLVRRSDIMKEILKAGRSLSDY